MYCDRFRYSGSYLPLILRTILTILAVAAIAVGVACGGEVDDEEPSPWTRNELVDQRFECEIARLRLGGTQVTEHTLVGWQLEGYERAETQSWEVLKRLRDFQCKALTDSVEPIPTTAPDAPTWGPISE